MARTIRGGDIGDYVNQQMEKLLRASVLLTDRRLKSVSPVATGRFSASWQVGENAAPGGVKPPGNYDTPTEIERLGYQTEKLGNVYSVHNNLPNAPAVCALCPRANGRRIRRSRRMGRRYRQGYSR